MAPAAAAAASSGPVQAFVVSQNAADQFKYTPGSGIQNLVGYDRQQQHALYNAIKSNERENESRRDAQKQVEVAKKSNLFLSAVIDCLPISTCSDDELKKMMECHAAVEAAGGVDAVRKMKKLCDDTDALLAERKSKDTVVSTKSSERTSTNRVYRKNLSAKGLSSNCVYMIEWDNLHQFATSNKLPVAHSFATVMSDCELVSKNPDADPEKIHLRLALIVYAEVNELYCTYRDGMMKKVTKQNAKELCERVFHADNVATLHAADGGFGSVEDYKKKLVHDSVMAISGRIPDFYSTIAEYTQSTSETGLRARSGVNYSERRPSKRARCNAVVESSSANNWVEELESDDEVEVEVEAQAGDAAAPEPTD